MLRSKLRNKNLKDKTDEAIAKYRKQRNICVHLLYRAKRNYYNDLDLSNLTDNRKFWKTIRLLFANKIKVKNKLLSMKIVNLLKMTKKWLTFLTLSLGILHLAIRYPAINHYLKLEIFQKLWSIQLKTLKIIVV